MKKIPLEIVLHTKKIPYKDFGEISLLGETIQTPLKRCKYCGKVPDVHYYSWNSQYTIDHFCKAKMQNMVYQRYSYEDLAKAWNGGNSDVEK